MSDRRWYIVQTYSGYENSVKTDLEARINTLGQQDTIFNVMIPEEEYTELKKDGTPVIKNRKMFPSYIFVEMIITEKSWFIVRNTPKVTGFLGSSGNGAKPIPLPQDEINTILRQIGELDTPEFGVEVGDMVKIVTGIFKDKIGEVSAISEEKQTVTVLLEVFGRNTPTELSFNDIQKEDC